MDKEVIKAKAVEKGQQAKWLIRNNQQLITGAVGGIFIGAGLVALFRKPVTVNAVVFAKVETSQ
jgi:hypothetical protein